MSPRAFRIAGFRPAAGRSSIWVSSLVDDVVGHLRGVPLLDRLVRLIQQVHQHLVLGVDLLDTHAEFVGPLDECAHGFQRLCHRHKT